LLTWPFTMESLLRDHDAVHAFVWGGRDLPESIRWIELTAGARSSVTGGIILAVGFTNSGERPIR